MPSRDSDMGGNVSSHAERRRSARLQDRNSERDRQAEEDREALSGEETDPDYVADVVLGSDSNDDDEDVDDMTDEDAIEINTGYRTFYIPLAGALRMQRRRRDCALATFQRVPDEPEPIEGPIAELVDLHTAAVNPRQRPCLGKALMAMNGDRRPVMQLSRMLRLREANMLRGGCAGGFSAAQRCHIPGFLYRPNQPVGLIDRMCSRAYIGQFSGNGDVFVAAFQHDRRIRLYETENKWRLRKDVHCRNLRWTVTDTCLSPDQAFLLYASITPTVHMVNMNTGGVESEANVTDIHEALHFDITENSEDAARHGFGIWSLRWAADGREVIAGTGDHSLYVFDLERQKTVLRVQGHDDDVNAVAFVEPSSHVIATGSDDNLIKVWDRRCLGRGRSHDRPAGVLPGHTEGLTHLDAKGDGRYLLSNSKDQTARIWDIRKMYTAQQYARLPTARLPNLQSWDYRWADYPARGYIIPHPHDVSVQTFRGHSVLQTLIRAYFSPVHTTGQRFIYTGSVDGTVRIYDIVSGKVVDKLRYHHEIVRDLSWHPSEPMLVTTSFDGTVVQWEPKALHGGNDDEAGASVIRKRRSTLPEDPGEDRLEEFY